MERFDDCVGAPAAGLGGVPRQDAGAERSERWHEPYKPGSERGHRNLARNAFTRGAQWHVSAKALENDLLHQLDTGEEARPDEPCRDADERGPQQRTAKQLHRNRAVSRENGLGQHGPRPRAVPARPLFFRARHVRGAHGASLMCASTIMS